MSITYTLKKLFCPSSLPDENKKKNSMIFNEQIQKLKNEIGRIDDYIRKLKSSEARITGLNKERAKYYQDQCKDWELKKEKLSTQLALRETWKRQIHLHPLKGKMNAAIQDGAYHD